MAENDVAILKQHVKLSARKIKLGHKLVFQKDNDPKSILPKNVTK